MEHMRLESALVYHGAGMYVIYLSDIMLLQHTLFTQTFYSA